jgi:uncharacterized protein (TIGR03663 family)
LGLILLLPLVADGLGRTGTVCAGVLTAISPVLVYYSRDYIHETLLVFFTFLALACGWRYYRSGKLLWAVLTGVTIGLMQSTKETFVLTLAAATTGLLANRFWKNRAIEPDDRPQPAIRWKHLLIAFGAWLIVMILFFSSFFSNASGPLDALRTYLPWWNRAAGNSPHLHPWYFYLERLTFFHVRDGPAWSEGLILVLALAGCITAVKRARLSESHPVFLRFLVVYTVTLMLIYCLIPYKTPWCLLSFWHGIILLAGVGAAAILHALPGRGLKTGAAVVLLIAAGQLAWQAWRAAFEFSADRRNPWVYAQTSADVVSLNETLSGLAGVDPDGRHLLVKVMAPGNDYWPMPWYLRTFDQVGWWGELPPDPFAPVIIVSTKLTAAFPTNETLVSAGMFELRPDNFVEMYVQSNLWNTYLEARSIPR